MSMEKRWPTLVSLVRREQRGRDRVTANSLRACGCPRCAMQLMMMGLPIPEEFLGQERERPEMSSAVLASGHHLDVKLN